MWAKTLRILRAVISVSLHGVSIQSVINLGKTFFKISRISNIAQTWLLARRLFVYLSSFISQILDFLYWKVCILIFHCVTVETENKGKLIVIIYVSKDKVTYFGRSRHNFLLRFCFLYGLLPIHQNVSIIWFSVTVNRSLHWNAVKVDLWNILTFYV